MKLNANFTQWNDNFIGNFWISRIIFNHNKDKAVVEFNSSNGGSKIYLSKMEEKWKIIGFFQFLGFIIFILLYFCINERLKLKKSYGNAIHPSAS